MNRKNIRQGYCPDLRCSERFVFDQTSLEPIRCHFCGNWCDIDDLKWVSAIDVEEAKRVKKRIDDMPIREDPEWTRLNGLSQFTCKLISSLFSLFGIDRDWRAVPLHDLGFNGFDYRLLANRSFAINKKHLYSPGYGIDTVGAEYLSEKLNKIKTFKDDNSLVPLKVSVHGISLLQCFSRALVGREIFLNPLLDLLTSHFQQHESWYLNNLQEFGFLKEEWKNIVQEYNKKSLNESIIQSKYDSVRIFALSNILCRPVVLLNAKKKKSQRQKFDSQLFLPILRKDEERRRKGVLIQPLVVAWNGDSSTSQIVPLVRMTGKPAPMLRRSFLPESFLCKKEDLDNFIHFDLNNFFCVADGRQCKNLFKMVFSMSTKYLEISGADLFLVADFVEDVLKDVELYHLELPSLLSLVCDAKKLWRCLICWHLCPATDFPENVLHRNGILYEMIVKKFSRLSADTLYTFATENMQTFERFGTFTYNPIEDKLEIKELFEMPCTVCRYKSGQLRRQHASGRIEYVNGDHTRTSSSFACCKRKMMHFWKEKFVDNPPLVVSVDLSLKGTIVKSAFFEWFEMESDENRNSDILRVAKNLIVEYFHFMYYDETDLLKVVKACQKALYSIRMCVEEICTETLWDFEKPVSKFQMIPKYVTTSIGYWTNLCKSRKLEFTARSTKKKLLTLGDVDDMWQKDISNVAVETSSVHFVLSNGQKRTVVTRKNIDYDAITRLIAAAFEIDQKDILWIFHRQLKMLKKSKYQLHDLKGTAFVLARIESNKENLKRRSLGKSPHDVCVEVSNNIRMYSLRLLYDSLESSELFWNFVEKSTEIFIPEGTVYEFAKISVGLRNNQHISLPGVLPDIKLVYSIVEDCFLSCQDRRGHFFIGQGIFDKVPLSQFGQKNQLISSADSIRAIAC